MHSGRGRRRRHDVPRGLAGEFRADGGQTGELGQGDGARIRSHQWLDARRILATTALGAIQRMARTNNLLIARRAVLQEAGRHAAVVVLRSDVIDSRSTSIRRSGLRAGLRRGLGMSSCQQ